MFSSPYYYIIHILHLLLKDGNKYNTVDVQNNVRRFSTNSFFHPSNLPNCLTEGLEYFRFLLSYSNFHESPHGVCSPMGSQSPQI